MSIEQETLNAAIDKAYEGLGNAVVTAAVEDWYNAKFILDTIDERKYKPTKTMTAEEHKDYIRKRKEGVIKEVERFIRSDWFRTLSGGLDGEKALEAMQETYKNEIFEKKKEDLRYPTE